MADIASAVLNRFTPIVLNGYELTQFKDIVEENDRLKEDLADFRSQDVEFEKIQEENNLLRAQLNVSTRGQFDLEIVNVFGFSYEEISSTAFIDRGERHGISVGMPVITGRSTLMGVVLEIYKNNSKIMLITDKRFKMQVLNESRERFLAIGGGQEEIELDFVTPRDEFMEGDLLVSEISDNIPGFLVIGEVSTVFHNESDLFKQVRVRPSYLDLNHRVGFVIKDF
ncbi:MAG: rod shape-determining protein MreC [Nitrososphaeraceae archaeon]|nr:rod shape-determining protein MreC [Nitrososphaeraceae archaeon]